MDNWIRLPQSVVSSRTEDLGWFQDAGHQKLPGEPRNVYWVPIKRRRNSPLSSQHIHSLPKRQSLPTLDHKSTAGVIASAVLFVVIIMSVLVFLIWRNSRYHAKAKSLKEEAETAAQASDARREMEMNSDVMTVVVDHGLDLARVKDRAKLAGSGQLYDADRSVQLGARSNHDSV